MLFIRKINIEINVLKTMYWNQCWNQWKSINQYWKINVEINESIL